MIHLIPQIYVDFAVMIFVVLKNGKWQMGALLNRCTCQLYNIYYIEDELD